MKCGFADNIHPGTQYHHAIASDSCPRRELPLDRNYLTVVEEHLLRLRRRMCARATPRRSRSKKVLPIFSEDMFMEKLNYIHQNPVRAGLVERAIDYHWSSARIWQGCPLENEPVMMDKDLIHWRRGRR